MAEVFMQKVVVQVAQSTAPEIRRIADAAAERRVREAAEQLQAEFEASKVTQEIDRGVDSPNISYTLRGGDPTENLFSFIGFTDGEKPTEPIRELIDPDSPGGPYRKFVGKDTTRTSVRFQYKAGLNEDAIWEETPLPWAPQMSWARKIEEGIQGFASFLDRRGAGHSEGGIMAKERGGQGPGLQILRDASYVPPEDGYLQTMFKRFYARLRKGKS